MLYSPGELLPKLDSYIGSVIEVRVPVEHLSLRNPQVRFCSGVFAILLCILLHVSLGLCLGSVFGELLFVPSLRVRVSLSVLLLFGVCRTSLSLTFLVG